MAPRRRPTPIVAVSGPSGSGKTRLLSRLIPALAARGITVALIKHTGHTHGFDQPGKDTEVLRRAGAVGVAIQGPEAMALFGPPVNGARALSRLLPPADLILAEGWRSEPLPRIEVHRRKVSRDFLCATDRRVVAVVTDEPPPRALPVFGAEDIAGVVGFLLDRLRLTPSGRAAGPRRARRTARRPSGL